MARKAKRSSCQVEHWWEDSKLYGTASGGKWKRCSDEELQAVIRHMLEAHYWGRPATGRDLEAVRMPVFRAVGLQVMFRQRFRGSTLKAIRLAYPAFFDPVRQDHLHEWDFPRRHMWDDEVGDRLAREACRHVIERHYLKRRARPGDLSRLSQPILNHVGLGGVLSTKFHGRTPELVRHAYPEFFDLSRPDHLHEWDLRKDGLWKGKDGATLACVATRHMLEAHHFGRSATAEDVKQTTTDTLGQLGLSGAVRRLGIGVLRHAYPEFFDWSKPGHLHEWDLQQKPMWRGRKGDALARTATRHMLEGHHLRQPAIPEKLRDIDTDTFTQLGLIGLLTSKFHSSPTLALRHAYPEFAEAIGRRIRGTADFVEVLETEDHKRGCKLIRDLMSHFGDDLVDVADILAVVYTGRLEAKTAMEILQDPTMRPWIVPFTGKGHGPGKPPIGDDFPFYLLEKDKNGVIAGIIRRRLTEWRRKVLGARPNQETRAKFLRELRELQDKFRANGGKGVALAAE